MGECVQVSLPCGAIASGDRTDPTFAGSALLMTLEVVSSRLSSLRHSHRHTQPQYRRETLSSLPDVKRTIGQPGGQQGQPGRCQHMGAVGVDAEEALRMDRVGQQADRRRPRPQLTGLCHPPGLDPDLSHRQQQHLACTALCDGNLQELHKTHHRGRRYNIYV